MPGMELGSAHPRELAAPECPWEAWSGLEVFLPNGFASIPLLPGTASQHESHQGLTVLLTAGSSPWDPFNWGSASGFTRKSQGLHGNDLGAALTQGQGISQGFPAALPLPGLPNAPKLLFYGFSKCQQNSLVIYPDHQAASSSSLVISTLLVTRSCLGRCPWQKLNL